MWYRFKWDKQNKSISLHTVIKSPERKKQITFKRAKNQADSKRSHRQWNDNFRVLKAWALNSV